MTPLFEAAGAKFNDDTGFYELNGLTDITEEQMTNIYIFTAGKSGDISFRSLGWGAGDIRTNIKPINILSIDLYLCSKIEIVVFNQFGNYHQNDEGGITYSTTSVYKFGPDILYNCMSIQKIYGIFSIGKISYTAKHSYSLPKLERIMIKGLHNDFSMLDKAPKINLESFTFLVDNATNSEAITITVHPDVYAKLTDPENLEWNALISKATEKQIQFATA